MGMSNMKVSLLTHLLPLNLTYLLPNLFTSLLPYLFTNLLPSLLTNQLPLSLYLLFTSLHLHLSITEPPLTRPLPLPPENTPTQSLPLKLLLLQPPQKKPDLPVLNPIWRS